MCSDSFCLFLNVSVEEMRAWGFLSVIFSDITLLFVSTCRLSFLNKICLQKNYIDFWLRNMQFLPISQVEISVSQEGLAVL